MMEFLWGAWQFAVMVLLLVMLARLDKSGEGQ